MGRLGSMYVFGLLVFIASGVVVVVSVCVSMFSVVGVIVSSVVVGDGFMSNML
jgi:hypothetical protein